MPQGVLLWKYLPCPFPCSSPGHVLCHKNRVISRNQRAYPIERRGRKATGLRNLLRQRGCKNVYGGCLNAARHSPLPLAEGFFIVQLIYQSNVPFEFAGNLSMTRSELIEVLAKRFPQLTADDAELAVKSILEAIARTLVKRRRVEIRGFGGFSATLRAPRKGRNPKTGESVQVPAKYVPHFRPGKELRERIDTPADRPPKPVLAKRG